MKNQKQLFIRGTLLVGDFFPKCGIDASVLVDLILYKNAKQYFKDKGYSFPDKVLCTNGAAIGDTKGVLINKYNYDPKLVDKEIDTILNDFFIEKQPCLKIEDDVKIIEDIGAEYELNEEDVPIIYQFWKQKVKMVIVRDEAFEKTCQKLNMIILPWPKEF